MRATSRSLVSCLLLVAACAPAAIDGTDPPPKDPDPPDDGPSIRLMDSGPSGGDAGVPGDPPPADDCGGLGYAGECVGAVARWCAGGEVREEDCAAYGQTCGWAGEDIGYYCIPGDPPPDPPPGTDAGHPGRDAGRPGTDAGRPGTDAGRPPPDPPPDEGVGTRVRWIDFPEQRSGSDPAWGAVLTDIERHLPTEYGSTYRDSDRVTHGHETTHGINSHIRNYFNDTGRRANGFYCLDGKAAVVPEPGMRKSAVAPFIPSNMRGSRYDLYITGSSSWDDTPLYVWDEWIAYVNGGEVGVDRARSGLWTEGWRDAVMGPLEFTIYALALVMAVEENDPTYFASETQFHEFFAYNARRAMRVFREGRTSEHFTWDRQDQHYERFRTSSETAAMRAFVVRQYGAAFAREVFEI